MTKISGQFQDNFEILGLLGPLNSVQSRATWKIGEGHSLYARRDAASVRGLYTSLYLRFCRTGLFVYATVVLSQFPASPPRKTYSENSPERFPRAGCPSDMHLMVSALKAVGRYTRQIVLIGSTMLMYNANCGMYMF